MANTKEEELSRDPEAGQAPKVIEDETAAEIEEVDLSEPKYWTGELSGVTFSASKDGDRLILSVTIEAEIPICLNDDMIDLQTLDLHARVFDFALKVALDDDEIDDVDIIVNLLGLIHVRDFLNASHDCLMGEMQTMRHRLEPGQANAQREAIYTRSVSSLKRIADRIAARLKRCIDAGDLSMVNTHQGRRLSH